MYNFLSNYRFANGLEVKNRIVMSPMTTMASFYNGMVTKEEIAYYALRAGGPGMIVTGVANVSESGKGEGLFTGDEMIPGWELAKGIPSRRNDSRFEQACQRNSKGWHESDFADFPRRQKVHQ